MAGLAKAVRAQRHRLHHALCGADRRGSTWVVLIGAGLVAASILLTLQEPDGQHQPAAVATSELGGMKTWVASAAGAIRKASGLASREEEEEEGEWKWYTKPLPPLKQREDIGAFLEVRAR